MNQRVPNKPGWWWLGDKSVEVRIQASGSLKNQLAYYVSEVRDFFAVDPNAAWGGECFQLSLYDLAVPTVSYNGKCSALCLIAINNEHGQFIDCRLNLDIKTDNGSIPGPGCPRYEGAENTESEEE